MKQTSLLIECFIMLISIVSGEGVKCEAGEGIVPMFTSGTASQCSGISKITTAAECNATAAYNSKNKVDNNEGYGIQWRGATVPHG